MTTATLRAPFPWFGGKSRAASLIWSRFGDVDTYNEPFAGSLAVLLGRPHDPRVETVNDLDCYLANFWRALQAAPEVVAYWADYPVNETDLHARHRWLVEQTAFQARMKADPEYFDAKIAGWWVWGQCLWIGSGWCQQPDWTGRGVGAAANRGVHRQFDRNPQGTTHQQRRPQLTRDNGMVAHQKRPKLSHGNGHGGSGDGCGVHRKRFSGTGNGQGTGVHSLGAQGVAQGQRRWQGGGQGGGSGVHAPRLKQQKPALNGDAGASGHGIHASHFDLRTGGLYTYLECLAVRLRRVRVCCGDWTRVLTPSVSTYIGVCGVLLDPPYKHELRERCYSEDHDISADVRAWAITNGDNPDYRIALCGYEGEHRMPDTWTCVPWKAHGGYSRTVRGRENRERERIWFSPHCLRQEELPLFAEGKEAEPAPAEASA